MSLFNFRGREREQLRAEVEQWKTYYEDMKNEYLVGVRFTNLLVKATSYSADKDQFVIRPEPLLLADDSEVRRLAMRYMSDVKDAKDGLTAAHMAGFHSRDEEVRKLADEIGRRRPYTEPEAVNRSVAKAAMRRCVLGKWSKPDGDLDELLDEEIAREAKS